MAARTSAVQRAKSAKFSKNITKRGKVNEGKKDKDSGASIGPYVIAFFLFVIVGSGPCPSGLFLSDLVWWIFV